MMPPPRTATATTTAPVVVPTRMRLAAALLAAALLAALLAPLPRALAHYLVPAGAPLPVGAQVLERLSVVDVLLVAASTAPTGAVAADTPLQLSLLGAPDADGTRVDASVAATGATEVWATGNRGAGAVVAVIDSGVARVPALEKALVGELDLSGTGGGDPYGHGTFIASLVAARGPLAPGVAPAADIVSLKVGDRAGETTLRSVLSALDWLHGPGRGLGIRVATLALGVDASSPAAELLDLATARLAAADVLVVTASGNDGPGALTSPATSPGTFSVGAYDAAAPGAAPTAAPFSGSGPDRVGVAQPDALAPGVSVIGHVPPDSIVGVANADRLDGTLLPGSGTSMATGLAAGVAALAVAARPDLGGAALDVALRNDAGVVDAPDAVSAALDAPAGEARPGNGKGRGRAAQAAAHGRADAPGQAGRADLRWETMRWKGVHWTGDRWTTMRWKDDAWTTMRWKGGTWAAARWGAEDWSTMRWKTEDWSTMRWKTEDWATMRWKTEDWATMRWKTEDWSTMRWKATGWALHLAA
jgi:serine protease AprX